MDRYAMQCMLTRHKNDIEILRVRVYELEQQNKRLMQMQTAAYSHLARLALKMERKVGELDETDFTVATIQECGIQPSEHRGTLA